MSKCKGRPAAAAAAILVLSMVPSSILSPKRECGSRACQANTITACSKTEVFLRGSSALGGKMRTTLLGDCLCRTTSETRDRLSTVVAPETIPSIVCMVCWS